jgi:predicted LPLAT superfamily acyltransferase
MSQTDMSCEAEISKFQTSRTKISNLAKLYVKELENIVKQYPEQWFNFYEFWKR